MKKLTKLLGIVLMVALVMSMGTMALADGNTISINQAGYEDDGTIGAETYSVYKVFDVTKIEDLQNFTNTNIGDDANIGAADTNAKGFAYTISADHALVDDLWNTSTNTAQTGQIWVKLTLSADETKFAVEWVGTNNEDAAKGFAAWLLAHKDQLGTATTLTSNASGVAEKDGFDDGYYLITSTLGTNLVLATTNITVNTKNSYPTTEKNVAETNYNVGDMVEYTIKVDLPASVDYNKPVIVHDTLAGVLDFQNDVTATSGTGTTAEAAASAAAATNATAYSAFTVSQSRLADDCTFEITMDISGFAPAENADPQPVTVIFKYTAELLSTALADTDYVNKEFVEYSKYKTPEDEAKINTYDFDLEKTFTGDTDNTNLTATFKLYPTVTTPPAEEGGTATTGKGTTAIQFVEETANTKYVKADSDDGTKTDTITVKQGTAVNVRGLSEGTYYLTEITTEDGYNKLADDIIITILPDGSYTATLAGTSVVTESTTGSGENAVTTNIITVVNNSGTVLPSTGGIGTTIFYVVGSVLVIAAGVLLVTKKRMGRD